MVKARRKVRLGRVVSDKMDKTVVVQVETHHRDSLYHKAVVVRRRYKAHDGENQCRRGDLVRIVETRPLSKEKQWRVAEIVKRGELAEVLPADIGVQEERP